MISSQIDGVAVKKVGERRIVERTCCTVQATIAAKGFSEKNVIIRDISYRGLRLYIPDRKWLPDNFQITCGEFDQPTKVEKIWSRPPYFGVRFSSAMAS